MSEILSWKWQDHTTLSSTNDYALADPNLSSKTVISAQHQTKGRGRLGNQWQSLAGNLFFTQFITGDLSVSHHAFISSLSLAQTCSEIGLQNKVSIKWPNDVLLDGKKICGILIEQNDNKIAIGIGVNLVANPNSDIVSYPTTNILSEGVEISREQFLSIYLKFFDQNYELCQQDFSHIRQMWLSYASNIGHPITVKTYNKTLYGTFKGIDESGLLLLEQENNTIKIAAGEVFLNTED